MLRGVHFPGDGESDEAADLAVAVAGRAGDAALGVALEAVLASVAVRRGLAVEAALLVARGVRVPAVAVAGQAAGPSFAVAFGALERPRALAPVALLDRGGVRHLDHFHFVVEHVRRPRLHVPRQGRGAVAGAVHVSAAVGSEGPGRLPLLSERLQLVVEGRIVVDLGDGHFLGRPRAPAAAVRHVGQQGGPGLVVRDLRRRRQRPARLGPVPLLLHIAVRGRHRHMWAVCFE